MEMVHSGAFHALFQKT